MMNLVIIIGAKSDMAQMLAKEFAKGGFDLLLVGRDVKSELNDFRQSITKEFGQEVFLYDLNILDKDATNLFFSTIKTIPDGIVSFIIGTHTHIPTLDAQILENGTAFQSDAGMCGDYDSVIGGEKEGWVARFKHKMPTGRINVSSGEATLCGVFVCINDTDGMAVHIEPIIKGPHLINRYPEKI